MAHTSTAVAGTDLRPAGQRLVTSLRAQPWGQISPSVYETARLVVLAPWLTGHDRRLEYLLASQRPDGAWGGPAAYSLVPTLSATDALLTVLRRASTLGRSRSVRVVDPHRLVAAARGGLRWLSGWLQRHGGTPVPDTPAIELILPALVEAVNRQVDSFREAPLRGFDEWRGSDGLPLPAGLDGARLVEIRSRLAAGGAVAAKLLHSIEVAGAAARSADGVVRSEVGGVGASPAATAAWLGTRGRPGPGDAALAYLENVVRQHGGAVPSVVPITTFERSWVLATLLGAGLAPTVPPAIVRGLVESLGESGTPGGPGLPPDADTTAVTLVALAQLGVAAPPDALRGYRTGDHFCTWPGERTYSTTVNAHVLEALGHLRHRTAYRMSPTSPRTPPVAATVDPVAGWLRERQAADGSWTDKWHASPYYPTARCALALHRHARDRSADVVRRAVSWVLATQRADGSWGRWTGTAEETAYAVQVLAIAGAAADRPVGPAIARGQRRLREFVTGSDGGSEEGPALWHDKDLYRPTAVVRATVLAALHLAERAAPADRAVAP